MISFGLTVGRITVIPSRGGLRANTPHLGCDNLTWSGFPIHANKLATMQCATFSRFAPPSPRPWASSNANALQHTRARRAAALALLLGADAAHGQQSIHAKDPDRRNIGSTRFRARACHFQTRNFSS